MYFCTRIELYSSNSGTRIAAVTSAKKNPGQVRSLNQLVKDNLCEETMLKKCLRLLKIILVLVRKEFIISNRYKNFLSRIYPKEFGFVNPFLWRSYIHKSWNQQFLQQSCVGNRNPSYCSRYSFPEKIFWLGIINKEIFGPYFYPRNLNSDMYQVSWKTV